MLITLFFISLLSVLIFLLYVKEKIIYYTLLSPVFCCLISFLIVFIMYPFGMDFLRIKTILILLSFLFAFFCSEAFVPNISNVKNKDHKTQHIVKSKDINKLSMLLILMQLIALFSAYLTLMKAINFAKYDTVLYASTSITSSQAIIRGVMSNEDYGIPIWLKIISQFKYINYIAPLFFMVLSHKSTKNKFIWFFSTILACCYSVFFLERSGIFRIIVLNSMFWYYWYKPSIKTVGLKMFSAIVVLVPVFNLILLLRGQADSGGGNIYTYFVGALAGLDSFVSGNTGIVDSLSFNEIYVTAGGYSFGDAPIGQETLTELFKFVNNILQLGYTIQTNQEYIYSPIQTNVYTAIRAFYQDYGFLGIPFVFILGIVTNYIHRYCMNNKTIWSGYIIAYLCYVAIYSVIAYNFLIRDILVPYIILLILTHYTKSKKFIFCRIADMKLNSLKA
ncbi:oligosaccharide repeat unit polymerase [Oryzomonas sagensis]|uniref:Oligosaccharide repeat unit polymerase n=1 Tax=Oryzomonas sagensis TaxID=2603857 RepID=A0ABQ6TQV1_9BACT|nr:O-antigen polymerase [Oryzomonas sagensis]KAB0671378.1 oligosaccharide repeat unit polymerase [Oryzomonas sagensis]